MNLTNTDKAILVSSALLLLIAGVIGAYAMAGGGGVESTPNSTVNETVDATEAPQAAQDSYDGAMMMKEELRSTEKFSDAKVFVTKRGEVVVVFESDAQYGPDLKNDMTEVAMVYSDVMAEYPETGGLTVSANGIEMLVSSDTALAHSEDRLEDDAYEKTFVYQTSE